MVAATETKPNKTAFTRDFLQQNPKSTFKSVNEAWTKAGHTDKVSETLVTQQRRDLGLSGNLRDRSKSMESNGAAVETGTRHQSVDPKATTPKAEGKSSGAAGNVQTSAKPVVPKTPATKPDLPTNGAARIDQTRPKVVATKSTAPRAAGKSQATGKPTSATLSEQIRIPRPDNKIRLLVELEGDIDELIYKVREKVGLPEVQDALRAARRLLVRSHEA